jgi:hypothetical protein
VQNNQVFHNRFAISELYFTSMHFWNSIHKDVPLF